MKLFISQPMKDKTDEEIKRERKRLIKRVEAFYANEKVEVIDSFFEGAPHDAKPLWFLGKSFTLLSNADVAIFAPGWDKYRGCKMEHEACVAYGIPHMDGFKDPNNENIETFEHYLDK